MQISWSHIRKDCAAGILQHVSATWTAILTAFAKGSNNVCQTFEICSSNTTFYRLATSQNNARQTFLLASNRKQCAINSAHFCLSNNVLWRGKTSKHCLRNKFQMFGKQFVIVWPRPLSHAVPDIVNRRFSKTDQKLTKVKLQMVLMVYQKRFLRSGNEMCTLHGCTGDLHACISFVWKQ